MNKRIRKRIMSLLMAVVILITTVVSVTGLTLYAESVAKAAGTNVVVLPINAGDTATSPSSIEKYFVGVTIACNGVFVDDDTTSNFYRLKLGTNQADAYCGNYGLNSPINTTYTARIANANTQINGDALGTRAYRIIKTVVCANRAAAAKDGKLNAEKSTYTAGQLTVWRALYLRTKSDAQKMYNKSVFINTEMDDIISTLAAKITPAGQKVSDTIAQIKRQIENYLTNAKNNYYANNILYVWNDGNPADQLLFSARNVGTNEEHGYIEIEKKGKSFRCDLLPVRAYRQGCRR